MEDYLKQRIENKYSEDDPERQCRIIVSIFIGGILSKDERVLHTGEDLRKCLITEIEEEVGLTEEYVGNSHVIGLVLSDYGNVGVITYIKLFLNSGELLNIFKKNKDDEFSKLEIIDKKDLKKYLLRLGGYKPCVIELLQ